MINSQLITKVFFIGLFSVSVLTACQKQESPTPSDTTTQETPKHDHAEHDHDKHDHDHAGHDHAHEHGDTYTCDNGKTVQIDTHDHEGEVMAHAIIDDIEYDLPEDSSQDNYYSSPEGLNNEGMALILTDNQATFTSLDGKTTHFTCQKSD